MVEAVLFSVLFDVVLLETDFLSAEEVVVLFLAEVLSAAVLVVLREASELPFVKFSESFYS
ncbi:hypothetical protein SPI02_23010 [Staphylococcus piscifermentans]|uniref:Uncharacterized protein n=1 Tax=Staphylococcus piscifermentans TaxID=70258 RepID=A0A512QQI3_9STAP|nr:hypothetical protein [Staphylococcus piscifermentans]GEP85716.1 hypothetical protein SPI02_23010 [Staphylococcus piscifermentans]